MKILYIISSVYNYHNFTFQMDHLVSDIKENEVTVAICDGFCKSCPANPYGAKIMCNECKKATKNVLYKIGAKVVKFSDFANNNLQHPLYKYNSIFDLKSIVYRDVQIGLGVASYYISSTRNLYPAVTSDFCNIINKWMETSMINTDIAYGLITKEYDKVVIVNGRMFDALPFQAVFIKLGIPFVMIETRTTIDGNTVHDDYVNCKVHTISAYAERMKKFWENSNVPLAERIDIAESFYKNRFNAIATNDKIYTKEQQAGLMPSNWDPNKKNIVIFNSSEDEFASLGGEFDENKLFNSQMEGILFLLRNTNNENIHYYLRIHPNLMNIPYRYNRDLLKLNDKFPNITVIPGNSKISSYSLMQAADKVITFGSTIGIESAFWGKKSMVLAPTFYSGIDVCYNPTSREEILSFINEDIRYTYNRDHALYFSYMCFNNEGEGIVNPICAFKEYTLNFMGRLFKHELMDIGLPEWRVKYLMYLNLLSIAYKKKFLPNKECDDNDI